MSLIKNFENFVNDPDRTPTSLPNYNPAIKKDITDYIDNLISSGKYEEVFKLSKSKMPKNISGEDMNKLLDTVRKQAINYLMENPEMIQLNKETVPIINGFPVYSGDGVPRTNNIGGYLRENKKEEKTKIFFDTEFTGLQQNTTLISIGLVSDCGKTFYAELDDYDNSQVDKWIKDNVINNLILVDNKNSRDLISVKIKTNMSGLKNELTKWFKQFGEIEMWSDCLAYDWVLFCKIFGTSFDIPKNIYYIPFDICTFFKLKGINPDISREEFAGNIDNIKEIENWKSEIKHNSLWDAYIIRKCYENLI